MEYRLNKQTLTDFFRTVEYVLKAQSPSGCLRWNRPDPDGHQTIDQGY